MAQSIEGYGHWTALANEYIALVRTDRGSNRVAVARPQANGTYRVEFFESSCEMDFKRLDAALETAEDSTAF